MTAYAVPHPETLSVGIALTQYRSSMTSPCFSPTGPSLDALLPSAGSPRVEFPGFNGTIRALRLPAVRPAALRCLRLAVPPWHARFAPTGVACDAGDQGFLLVCSGCPLPEFRWKRQGLSRSWATPIVLLPCSSTPAGSFAPGHYGATMQPPLCPRRRRLHCGFRGSITRLRHLLSTLRRMDYSTTT